MKVGIIGASGYSGEELVRLLDAHPEVELSVVTSRSFKGRHITEAIPSLRGKACDLVFQDSDPVQLAQQETVDLFFLALPHGVASGFARPLIDAGKKVIDLSADFRLNSPELYEEYYGSSHPDIDLLKKAVYIIPELKANGWQDAQLIACPGCYPTSVQIPLVPLLRDRVMGAQGIVVNAFSGVSGAGKKVSDDFMFCARSESAKAYGLPKHRHLSEIEEQLTEAADAKVVLQFSPHLAPMRRGIIATITVPAGEGNLEALYASWREAYMDCPFVTILESGNFPDSQYVMGTNRVDISAVYDPRTKNFVITAALDNLLKGAGGQAVQIMNLWFGFSETAGLV